ncbi:ABC transporter permease [Roseococcus sp. YIM B11640]|uniref:ABC transporter permease n=1 Tax=Roseococcus sp. YIM B11640 TaxID=3133973 RepID=UPI003C7C4FED
MSTSVPIAGGASLAVRWPLPWWPGLLASASWALAAFVTHHFPDQVDIIEWAQTEPFAIAQAAIAGAFLVLALIGPLLPPLFRKVQPLGPWFVALGLFFAVWQLITAKLSLLPMPFFVPPQQLVEVYLDDWPRLSQSVLASLWLLARGYALGAAVGFLVGLGLGWSPRFGYWAHPVMRLVGPLPATAWLPLAFFLFPSSASASTFLIALATGFPVAVLTWSGVASVDPDFYDVARTLGAKQRFLVLKVAVPAALPHVFVGLFMGLGSSFAVLVVAEMLGVRSGLGWYLSWAQGWAAYGNMYAALLVMALMCSALITLLFRLRDRLLSWQKGVVKW